MSETIDPKNIDARLAQRYIKQGLLSEKDWEKYLKSLPDASENAAPVEATLEHLEVKGTGRIEPEEE